MWCRPEPILKHRAWSPAQPREQAVILQTMSPRINVLSHYVFKQLVA